MRLKNTKPSSCFIEDPSEQLRQKVNRLLVIALVVCVACLSSSVVAQTITVVGTPHLKGLEVAPSAEQLAHTVEALSAFEPTQVCVERMSGDRIEVLMGDPARNAMTLRPETAGRPLATMIVPVGVEMQAMLERRPADARDEGARLVSRWNELDVAEQIQAIGLQLAGYEFHSAVLNWSYLDEAERKEAAENLGEHTASRLEEALHSVHEVYSLGVPLARKAGLHQLCTADSQEDETRGMQAARKYDGDEILESPEVRARFEMLIKRWTQEWQPDSGPQALTAMLRFFNSDEFTELDRRLQWETLREFDNEAGAFQRRLMYWHARTAQISAELFRALAKGPDERVIFIVGSAHRPFTEADLRAQPWVKVKSASELVEE
ncbi:MAG: DUF5694 domain-containing protein [Wenzhouxiangella sp.]